jgi:NADH:ubiquinone oxidoreductase subunit F (NADH-binding)
MSPRAALAGDPAAAASTTAQARQPVSLALGARAGIEPRLLLAASEGREDYDAYRARGGYAERGAVGEALIEALEWAGLRGRGGAAFPAATKLRSVADRDGPRFVVANGEEGEPASLKDRWLLRYRPHLVLDGLLRASAAVDAQAAYVFVSDPAAAASVERAFEELDGHAPIALELVTTEPRYVAGEETAVVRAINGGPALPLDKPPRPFESGVQERPTLVANVETLANVPAIAVDGAERYRELGTERSPGTFLLTVSGACERPGLYEVPLGDSLGATLDELAGLPERVGGFLMGGFFAGLLAPRAREARLAYDELRDEGSGLGCGAIVVLSEGDCPVAAAADVIDYFERENAKQCGACIRGTAAMRDAVFALASGEADEERLERLRGWSLSLRERGACALLDGAAGLVGSLLREFPREVDAHLANPCPKCASLSAYETKQESRFALSVEGGFHDARKS